MNNPVSGESSASGQGPHIAVGPAAVAIRRPELLEHNTTIYHYMKTKKVIKGTASDGVGECLMLHEAYTKWIFPLEDAEELAERCDKAEELLVRLMSWLDQSEIDAMDNEDYEKLKAEINKFIAGKKK